MPSMLLRRRASGTAPPAAGEGASPRALQADVEHKLCLSRESLRTDPGGREQIVDGDHCPHLGVAASIGCGYPAQGFCSVRATPTYRSLPRPRTPGPAFPTTRSGTPEWRWTHLWTRLLSCCLMIALCLWRGGLGRPQGENLGYRVSGAERKDHARRSVSSGAHSPTWDVCRRSDCYCHHHGGSLG